jgi:hypothetical protein
MPPAAQIDAVMQPAAQVEETTPPPAGKKSNAQLGPLMPPDFDHDYVTGAIVPFLNMAMYLGEAPLLPMIGVEMSKEGAVSKNLWGMLYEDYKLDFENQGLSVFIQGYQNRGPNNERSRIYQSAVTPDLFPKYRAKINTFYDRFLADANAGTPMMKHYFDNYYDLYWGLHVGATGDEIPEAVKEFSKSFNVVLGFNFPTMPHVRDAYMKGRETRPRLIEWLDERVQLILDGKLADADTTWVYYWLKNGELGENFRRIDLVFECFHNFVALSQWGNVIYNTGKRLQATEENAPIRAAFERTMSLADPDAPDGGAFTPLERLIMELFRVINANDGSGSIPMNVRRDLNEDIFSGVVTPHGPASMSPLHWENPTEFDPDRYNAVPLSSDDGETRAKAAGLAKCPFDHSEFAVKDGRDVKITNSPFGADYPVVEGVAHPLADTAGYSPFGFGYRRCPGELMTVEFMKEFLRRVWAEKISFTTLDIENPDLVPTNPKNVLIDNIAFTRAT